MKNKSMLATLAATLLLISGAASADTVTNVWSCKLNDGKTSEDAHALNGKWLKWAHEVTGDDSITSSFVTTAVGDIKGFMWVDMYPDFSTWAKLMDADPNEELEEAFDALQTCSGSRLYRGEESEPAK